MIQVFSFLLSIFIAQSASASSISITLDQLTRPANDLVFEGNAIDSDEATELARRNIDISKLDPTPNNAWPTDGNSDDEQYPPGDTVLVLDSMLSSVSQGIDLRILRASVDAPAGKRFFLALSPHAHGALVRNSLLRKLGYRVAEARHYRKIRLHFQSVKEKVSFLEKIEVVTIRPAECWLDKEDNGPLPKEFLGQREKNVTLPKGCELKKQSDLPETDLVLQDVVLEPARVEVPQYHWGAIKSTYVQYRRATRALLLPLVLGDIPESINLFSPEAGKILSGSLILTQPFASEFQDTSIEDLRWIMRIVGKLTREDFRHIIDDGRFPEDVAALLLEKIIARRNNLIGLTGLGKEFSTLPVNLKITTGAVVKGKLTRDNYDGYGGLFSYGDPESPLKIDDVARYLRTEATSSAIQKLIEKINTLIPSLSTDDLVARRQKELGDFIRNLIEHPDQPASVPLKTWGGPVAGVNINAGRSVSSGAYYGVDSRVQLVDSIGVQASVGYFMARDGIPNVIPNVSGNLIYRRDYVHIRPLSSMKEAIKADMRAIWVPGFMKSISRIVQPDLADTDFDKAFTEFTEELKEGETMIVTDTLGAGVNGMLTIPIFSLMSFEPILGQQLVARFGAGTQAITLSKTYITRTKEGLQVYLTHAKSSAFQTTLDFNFWINILNLTSSVKSAQANTRAYLMEVQSTDQNLSDEQSALNRAENRKMILSLRGLLSANKSELLEKYYSPFALHHDYKSKTNRLRFLSTRDDNIEETHRVKLRPPRSEINPIDPLSSEGIKLERTLYSSRIAHRKGQNYYALLSDVINAYVPGLGPAEVAGGDPGNSFYGRSSMSSTSTEAEITDGRDFAPVTLSANTYSGWKLSQKDLFKLIDGIEKKLSGLSLNQPFIRKDVFTTVRELQLYEISTTLIVYPKGIENLMNGLLRINGRKLAEPQAVDAMISLQGEDRFMNECRNIEWSYDFFRGTPPGNDAGCILKDMQYRDFLRRIDAVRDYPCLLKWMQKLLTMRETQPKTKEETIIWNNRLVELLLQNVEFSKVLKILGEGNYFFQARISGYRKNDENGDQEFISNSLGKFDEKLEAGIFGQFINNYQILAYEIHARYLGEGL